MGGQSQIAASAPKHMISNSQLNKQIKKTDEWGKQGSLCARDPILTCAG